MNTGAEQAYRLSGYKLKGSMGLHASGANEEAHVKRKVTCGRKRIKQEPSDYFSALSVRGGTGATLRAGTVLLQSKGRWAPAGKSETIVCLIPCEKGMVSGPGWASSTRARVFARLRSVARRKNAPLLSCPIHTPTVNNPERRLQDTTTAPTSNKGQPPGPPWTLRGT